MSHSLSIVVRRYSLWCFVSAMLLAAMPAYAQDPTGVIRKNTRDETFELGNLGVVHMLIPTAEIKSVAIFIDGDGGWNDGIVDMAQLLANQGALVAGVDTQPYLQALDADKSSCASAANDFEKLTRFVEARYQVETFMPPTLVGYSSGATLAYAVLAQAPLGKFSGAITLGFCTTLEMQRSLCSGRSLALHHTKEGLALLPRRHLDATWLVLHGNADQACTIKEVGEFAAAIPSARLITLPRVGHGYAVARRWQPQYVAAYKKLASTRADHSATAIRNRTILVNP